LLLSSNYVTICGLLSIVVVAILSSSIAFSEENVDALKMQLAKLQQEISDVNKAYKEEQAAIRKQSDSELYDLKKQYHKDRADYIARRKDREAKSLTNYNKTMTPLLAERTRIQNLIEPLGSNNFAKTKEDKEND